MAEFDDGDLGQGVPDDGAIRTAAIDPPPPVINGGLLDPRTFPSWLRSAAAPPSAGDPQVSVSGVDPDTHAEVLQDILDAQAKLPPIQLHLADNNGLRHIDPYPGMNRTPTGGYPPLTRQAASDFLNGVPLPTGAFGPHITFINDEPGKPSTDRPVTNALADMVEQAVLDSGLHSVNINSSVRPPKPGGLSNHPSGNAVDINNIDGFRVINRPDLATQLQDAFARQQAIHENFGPGYQVKTVVPGQPPAPWAGVGEDHQNHDHFSARR